MTRQFLYFILALAALTLTACEKKDIGKVVKEMSESPVDTTGMLRTDVLTNDFTAVVADCFADITYHQTTEGTPSRVTIKAQREVLPHVRVHSDGGELLIAVDRTYRMPPRAVVVVDIYDPFSSRFSLNGVKCLRLDTLTLRSPLRVEVFGGVGAVVAHAVQAEEISLELIGEGSIDLSGIETRRLSADLDGNGLITLSGSALEQQFTKQGKGVIDAVNLKKAPPAAGKPAPAKL